MAFDAMGRTAEGLEILRRNLALGREHGYLRSFVDEGAPMLALLRRLSRSQPVDDTAYVRQLIALLRESQAMDRLSRPLDARRSTASSQYRSALFC